MEQVYNFKFYRDDAGRQAKKLDDKRDRGLPRSNSRRPTAKVKGIGLIQRKGDVLVGMRPNSTAHIIETQILIGPLQCVMDKKAGFLLQQSRVSMPQLTAKLRLTVCIHVQDFFFNTSLNKLVQLFSGS